MRMTPDREPQTADSRRRLYAILAAIAVLALFIRLAAVAYFRTYDLGLEHDHWPFGFDAGRIARSLAQGQGFASPHFEPSGPTALLAPAFPFLMAGIFRVLGVYTRESALAIYFFDSLLSALTCLVLYRLGERIFGAKVGLAAALAFALYPPAIWHAAATIWDTTLSAFAMVSLMAWLYCLPRRPRTGQLVQTGLLMGLVALVNPVPLMFYPIVALVIWFRLRDQGLRALLATAVLTASCALVVLPWMVRNAVTVGAFTPRTCIGMSLWRGNNPAAWKAQDGAFQFNMSPDESPAEGRIFDQLGEVGYDHRCARIAMEFIRANPGKFAVLTLVRARAWWFGQSSEFSGNLKTKIRLAVLKRIVFLVPLPFLVIGCAAAWRRRKSVGLLLAFLAVYPLAYYVSFVMERYRFPTEPFMVLLETYGAFVFVSFIRGLRRSPTACDSGLPLAL